MKLFRTNIISGMVGVAVGIFTTKMKVEDIDIFVFSLLYGFSGGVLYSLLIKKDEFF